MSGHLRKTLLAVFLLVAPAAWAQGAMPPQVLDGTIAFAEFLVAGRLDPALRAQYAAVLADEYQHDPRAAAAMSHVDAALAKLEATHDPVQRGVLRERAWARNAQDLTRTHGPWLQREVETLKAAPSVIGDAGGGRLVTVADVLAQVAADDAIAALAGLAAVDQAAIEAYVRDLRAQFATLSPAQRENLAQAASRLAALKRMLGDPHMRAAVLRDIRAHVHGQSDLGSMARAQEQVALRFTTEPGRELAMLRHQLNMAARYDMTVSVFAH